MLERNVIVWAALPLFLSACIVDASSEGAEEPIDSDDIGVAEQALPVNGIEIKLDPCDWDNRPKETICKQWASYEADNCAFAQGKPATLFGHVLLPKDKAWTLLWDTATLYSQSVSTSDPRQPLTTQPFVHCHPARWSFGNPFQPREFIPAGGRFVMWGKATGNALFALPGFYNYKDDVGRPGLVRGTILYHDLKDEFLEDGNLILALQKQKPDDGWVDIATKASTAPAATENGEPPIALEVSALVETQTTVRLVARVGKAHGAQPYVFEKARLFVPTCVRSEETGECF